MRDRDWVFLGAIVAFGLTAIAGVLLFLNELRIEKPIEIASTIATTASFLLAAFIFYRNSYWRRDDVDIEKSAFLFEEAIKGYSRACDLLSDQNNDRIKWIMAARAIGEAERLFSDVVYGPHKSALEIRKIEFRNLLYERLTLPDDKTGARKALPIQFFLGAQDLTLTPIEAARQATAPLKAYSISEYGNHPAAGCRYLEPASVYAVFDFLKFPDRYEDPLDTYRNRTPSSVGDAYFTGEGAMNFLLFLDKYWVNMGMCYRKDDEQDFLREKARIESEDLNSERE